MSVRLSKSKLIAFRQCPKRLWLEIHRPELKVWDEAVQRRFTTGYQVGELAQREHPSGYLIAPDDDLARAKAETQAEIASGRQRVLFEATFEAKGILVRADLLIPRNDGWHMVEVKSTTQPKSYHLEDAAIQSWVVREAGLALAATSLQLIDSKWIYPGGGNYAGIFKIETVDDRVQPLLGEVPRWLEAAMGVAEGSEPSVKMGEHCNDPFACAFQEYCGSSLKPVEMPISWIPNLRSSKRAQLEAQGIVDIRQVDLEMLTDSQRSIAQGYLKGEVVRHRLPEDVTQRLTGTRYYVDFETAMFGVPIWQGTRPYEQIPFQWSCHIEEPGQPMRHLEFLDLSGEDPSRKFAESLIEAVGKVGPVIVYNVSFEATRLRELAVRFADDLAMPLEAIAARMVDLRPITRRHFFHPGLMGSWTLKSVLKAIRPDLAHELLGEVAEGGAAPEAYLEAIEEGTTPARREEIRKALLAYCERDTEAMVHVLGYLSGNRDI